MKLSISLWALAAETTFAHNWFSKTGKISGAFNNHQPNGQSVYNKWHETELERWLSDNNVPYPTPADRKDLENLVKKNWNDKVVTPYTEWEPAQIQHYLKSKGHETSDAAASNKNALVKQVKSTWTETGDSASDAYENVRDWIFDSYV